MSDLEAAFALRLRVMEGVIPPAVMEYKFHPKRRFRFDFAWPEYLVAVEVEGGVWSGGRHVRPVGFLGDAEKYNEAMALGWRVLRVTDEHIQDGRAIDWLRRALCLEGRERAPF